MKMMSKDQEELMQQLLIVAGGDMRLLERAFTEATPTVPGYPPSIRDLVYFMLRERGHENIVQELEHDGGFAIT